MSISKLPEPPEFAADFVSKLRSRCADDRLRPSVRHTVALARLLEAIRARKGRLTLEDYIRAALAISPPELKDIALAVLQDMFRMRGRRGIRQPYGPLLLPMLPVPAGLPSIPPMERLDERARRVLSKVMAGKPEALEEFRRLAEERPADAAKLYRRIRQLKIPEEETQKYLQALADSIRSLEQFYEVIQITRVIPSDISRILQDAYNKYSLSKAYRLADKIDGILSSNMRELVVKYFSRRSQEEGRIIPLEEVALSPAPIKEWRELFERAFQHELRRALKAENPVRELEKLERQLRAYMSLCGEGWCLKPMKRALKQLQRLRGQLAKESTGGGLLRRLLRKRRGSAKELARKRYDEVYEAVRNGEVDVEELVHEALKAGNREALAAAAHADLPRAVKAAQRLHAMQQLLESLSAGPGENLLKEWYRSGRRIPPRIRRLLRAYVKEILLKVGREYTIARFGGLEGGVLPSYTLKPYEPGEDPSSVDLEETLDNILSQGKLPKYIRYEDLLMRGQEHGKLAIVLLNDISGSMAGEKVFYVSICSLVLLYAFKDADVAIGFFESDTYKVKEIDEPMHIDDIADELLSIEAFGGTCVSAALLWAREQLAKSRAKHKVLILLTDCAFYDYEQALVLTERLIRSGVRVFVIAPSWSYEEMIARALQELGARLLFVEKVEELPDLLAALLSEL